MAAIHVGAHTVFNSDSIAMASIDGHRSTLTIRLKDGKEYYYQHTAGYYDGIDIYKIKSDIDAALAKR